MQYVVSVSLDVVTDVCVNAIESLHISYDNYSS